MICKYQSYDIPIIYIYTTMLIYFASIIPAIFEMYGKYWKDTIFCPIFKNCCEIKWMSILFRDNVLTKLVEAHRRCLRSRSLLRDICSSRWSFVSCISAARRCAFFLAADSCLLWSSASSIASCSWRGIN